MAYERVIAAFPRRPLSLSRSRRAISGIVVALLGALAFAGFAIGIAVNYVPDLLTDMAVARDPVDVQGNAGYRCSIHRAIISTCTVEIRYQSADKRQRYHEAELLFLGRLDRDQPLTIRQSRANPDQVSTSWGESYLTDRWLTLGAAIVLFGALGIACAYGAVGQQRGNQQRRLLAGSPHPVPVMLRSVVRAKGQSTWTFDWSESGRTFRAKDMLRGKRAPLLLDPAGGVGLALTDADGRAMLLDEALSDVGLTDAERTAVIEAVTQSRPSPAVANTAPAPPVVQR